MRAQECQLHLAVMSSSCCVVACERVCVLMYVCLCMHRDVSNSNLTVTSLPSDSSEDS